MNAQLQNEKGEVGPHSGLPNLSTCVLMKLALKQSKHIHCFYLHISLRMVQVRFLCYFVPLEASFIKPISQNIWMFQSTLKRSTLLASFSILGRSVFSALD